MTAASTQNPHPPNPPRRDDAGEAPPVPSPHVPAPTDETGRQYFAAEELAIVLSHFDLGEIESAQPFARGSRKAPKLFIKARSGLYLLKRRARGKDDPYKVAFCHGIQLHLAEKQFPLPHLVGTRRDNNSMLKLDSGTYELFEFIKGNLYDSSLEATGESGKVLSLFHKLLADYRVRYEPARGSYHRSAAVMKSLQIIPRRLAKTGSDASREQQAEAVIGVLIEAYRTAASQAENQGLSEWPEQIVHSDWHPGNMLFRGEKIVAVIDYDAARKQQRILDVANGALQFSILGGGDDPSTWPEDLDGERFKRFIRGYDSVPDNVLTRAELRVMPLLMIEALIAEAAIPIAATGLFGNMDGLPFLQMVQRKVRWLQQHTPHIIAAAEG